MRWGEAVAVREEKERKRGAEGQHILVVRSEILDAH